LSSESLDEAFARLAAHALGWRVGRDQRGMLAFQRLQLVDQAVELGVGNLRVVEHVVAMLVVADLLAQLLRAPLDVFGRSRHGVQFQVSTGNLASGAWHFAIPRFVMGYCRLRPPSDPYQ
jgi:hypothetical protein